MQNALSQDRLDTLKTICKLTDNPQLNLYAMDVLYDYDLSRLTPRGVHDTQTFMELAFAEALPGVHVDYTAPDYGCSAFTLVDEDGTVRMGRNYDFKFDTSAMQVYCHPKDGYASVAHAALNNVGADDPDSSPAAKAACLTSPFIILDGINEKGLGVAVLTLDSEPVSHDTGKPVLPTTVLLRLLLDKAASTAEAVELLRGFDMYAISGRDYHFYLTDATGDGRVVEFDCESPERPMTVTPSCAVTNFYLCHKDQVLPNQKNGIYGHGRERYDAILATMEEGRDKAVAWKALKAASQEPNPESITSNTQWSIVYDLTNLSGEFALHRDWADIHPFALK